MADTTTKEHAHHEHHEHGEFMEHMRMRRKMREAKSAREELQTVEKEIDDILQKKDIHVHNTHEWLHKLHRATKKLLRDHETELDNAEQSSAWVNDALDSIYDADKQCVALAKAIVAASGHRVAKDADFKPDVESACNAIKTSVEKSLAQFPETEK